MSPPGRPKGEYRSAQHEGTSVSAPGASLSASLAQRLPLLARRDLAAPLAWRAGVAHSAGLFIAQAQALAARWPGSAQPINLCQDQGRKPAVVAVGCAIGPSNQWRRPPSPLGGRI